MDINETYQVIAAGIESVGNVTLVEVPVHIADEDVEDYIANRLYVDYGIAPEEFEFTLQKKVINIMSGKEILIDIDTPLCCDPSSETYWSM